MIPVGEKVVFYLGVKSKKIPEGKIGTIKGYKYLTYINKKSNEKEYTILYNVEFPNGLTHRTQARCIMRLSDWENPSCREAMLKENEKENIPDGDFLFFKSKLVRK